MEQKPGDLEDLAETSAKIPKDEKTTLAPTSTTSQPAAPPPVESFPDPDEDDLDDLDGKFICPYVDSH
jgi:peroxin-19